MKTLVLASSLGLTLLANTAFAATNSQDYSVWRNIDVQMVKIVEQDVKDNNWHPTQFNTVESAKEGTLTSKIWRKIPGF